MWKKLSYAFSILLIVLLVSSCPSPGPEEIDSSNLNNSNSSNPPDNNNNEEESLSESRPSSIVIESTDRDVSISWSCDINRHYIYYNKTGIFPDDLYSSSNLYLCENNFIALETYEDGDFYFWIIPIDDEYDVLLEQKSDVISCSVEGPLSQFDFSNINYSIINPTNTNTGNGSITIYNFDTDEDMSMYSYLFSIKNETKSIEYSISIMPGDGPVTVNQLSVGDYKFQIKKGIADNYYSFSDEGVFKQLPFDTVQIDAMLRAPDISNITTSISNRSSLSSVDGTIIIDNVKSSYEDLHMYDPVITEILLLSEDIEPDESLISQDIQQMSIGDSLYFTFNDLDIGSYRVWLRNKNSEVASAWIEIDSENFDILVEGYEGRGIELDPFIADDIDQLKDLCEYSTSDTWIRLTCDIDGSNYNYPFFPMGHWNDLSTAGAYRTFSGHLDGGFNTIENVYLNVPDGNSYNYYNGIFGYLLDAEISNLGFENVVITSENDKMFISGGIIAGTMSNSSIENCYVSESKVLLACIDAGALVGTVEDNSLIKNCYAYNNHIKAGFVGDSSVSVHAGGLIGKISGGNSIQTIENCYAAAISSSDLSWNAKIDTLKFYYYSSNGNESEYLGGFMGLCGKEESLGSITIKNNLFISSGLGNDLFRSDRGYIFRFGYSSNELDKSNYAYLDNYSGSMNYNGSDLPDGSFDVSIEPLANWDFNNIWTFDELLNRPVLANF